MSNRDKFQDTVVCMTGEYYVAAELWRQGWIAGLTPKNCPGYDVIAYHPKSQQQIAIQVKTRFVGPNEKVWNVQVPKVIEEYAPFLVIVAVRKTKPEEPAFYSTYILTGIEAFQLARRTHEEYLIKSPHVNPDKQHFVLDAKDLEKFHLNKWNKIFSQPNDE